MLRLPTADAPQSERYAMPDPDALIDAYYRLYRSVWYDKTAPNDEDIKSVLILADGYLGLTMYELGQECCVSKLRDIWRARRARETK